MIERMEEVGGQLTRQDIQSLESVIGMTLPDEYKAFLLKYNGGRPTPNAYPIEGLPKNPFGVIQVFFGIGDPIDSCNLNWHREVLPGRLPANLFPIACDGGGDLICLSLFGEDVGAIVFWDQHTEPPEPSYENVYRIAGSFAEFLDGFRELPE